MGMELWVLILTALASFVGGALIIFAIRNWGGAETTAQGSRSYAMAEITPAGDVSLSRGATAMLSGGDRLSTIDALVALIADESGDFAMAVKGLVGKGAAFELPVEGRNGRRIRAFGETRGKQAAIVFQDETTLREELDRAACALTDAQIESKRALEALDARGEIAWIRDRRGDLVWGSSAFQSASRTTRETLAAVAPTDSGDNALIETSEDAERRLFTVERKPLTRNEVYFSARAARPPGAEDAAFSRFVNTMSETFAHLKVGLMIYDQERRLILFNPATIRLFALDPAFLARRPGLRDILDAMRESRAIPEQTDYTGWRDEFLARLDTTGEADFEENWHLADGRTVHLIARPHPSGGLAMTAEDISEAVALRRINASERAVLHATTDFLEEGVIVFGPNGLSRTVNQAFIDLWDFAPGLFEQPVHVKDVAAHCSARTVEVEYWDRAVDHATAAGPRRAIKEKVELKNGRVLSARISPMPDGSAMLVNADITASERVAVALRERNEALEHADEMRGALVDQISHQMRTPLNAVFGFGQLLSDERFGELNDRQREYVTGIVASSTELLDAINGMTDLITVGQESMSLGGEALDPMELAYEVVDIASRRFEGRGRRIEAVDAGAPASFFAHKVRLRQIIFNLFMDALQKSPPGETATLSISADEGALMLVCEHMAGEDPSDRGLAVSLIRRFIGLHGGHLEIAVDDRDRRRLICRLPEADEALEPVPAPASPQSTAPLAVEERSL